METSRRKVFSGSSSERERREGPSWGRDRKHGSCVARRSKESWTRSDLLCLPRSSCRFSIRPSFPREEDRRLASCVFSSSLPARDQRGAVSEHDQKQSKRKRRGGGVGREDAKKRSALFLLFFSWPDLRGGLVSPGFRLSGVASGRAFSGARTLCASDRLASPSLSPCLVENNTPGYDLKERNCGNSSNLWHCKEERESHRSALSFSSSVVSAARERPCRLLALSRPLYVALSFFLRVFSHLCVSLTRTSLLSFFFVVSLSFVLLFLGGGEGSYWGSVDLSEEEGLGSKPSGTTQQTGRYAFSVRALFLPLADRHRRALLVAILLPFFSLGKRQSF